MRCENRLGVELDAPHGMRPMPNGVDLIGVVGGNGKDLERFRHRVALHHERVIAHYFHGAGQAIEQVFPVVNDSRGLSVHEASGADMVTFHGGPIPSHA